MHAVQEQENAVLKPMRRLANSLACDVHKYSCRGTMVNGELRSATAPSAPPQVLSFCKLAPG